MSKVVYIHRQDGTDMRLSKQCNSLQKAGYDVTFLGWERFEYDEKPDPMPTVEKRLFQKKAGAGPAGVALSYLSFIWFIFKQLRQIKPEVVHSVNEDTTIFLVLGKPIYGYRLICDIYDSIALRWSNAPLPLAWLARFIAFVVHRGSDALLVTDKPRWEHLGPVKGKAAIVANYPVDPGTQASRTPLAPEPIRLYVAGSLSKKRGLEQVLALAEQREDIELVCAGWLYDDYSKIFSHHEKVTFHGVITPAESLKLAASCHAIVALYAPTNHNNLLASPNKLYDALAIGRQVIINREAKVSSWVTENKTGFVLDYGDVKALHKIADQLRKTEPDTASRLRRLFETGYGWHVAEAEMLAVYQGFNQHQAPQVA